MTDQTLKDIDRAFKALEERDELLGKIKAEIAKRTIDQGFDADEWSISYDELMKIIDKYKAESKPQESEDKE